MHWLIHLVKKALLFPFDLLAYTFGKVPPSYYEDVQYEDECDRDMFEKNDVECRRKYGMSMLEKIRFEEKKIMGDAFKEIEAGRVRYFDPWYRLDVFHDMMCRIEGLFDELLEEYLAMLRAKYGVDENDKSELQ